MPKRKHSCLEDPEFSMSPCFRISEGVELVDIPSTGEEFLLKVMFERQNCAVVTKANQDLSVFAKKQTYFVEPLEKKSAPNKLKPTLEWQVIQVEDFKKIRNYVIKIREDRGIVLKRTELDFQNFKAWKTFIDSKKPSLNHIIKLHQVYLERILKVIQVTMSKLNPGETIDHQLGQWAYAVLACIRQPLLSDTIHILRTLVRTCAEVRSNLDPELESASESARPLNIFICLVSHYFGQFDLAD